MKVARMIMKKQRIKKIRKRYRAQTKKNEHIHNQNILKREESNETDLIFNTIIKESFL